MKQFLFLLFVLIFAQNARSASYYSSLYIELDRDKYYEVTLDDDSKRGYGNIEFTHVSAGTYRLTITELRTNSQNYSIHRKTLYNKSIRFEDGCQVYAYLDSWDKIYLEYRNCDDYKKKKKHHRDYLSNKEFREALDIIKNQSFESGKEAVAKQIISDYDITVDQLIDILNEMSFESTKLELAKYGYDNMDDVRSFYKVYNVFSFSSSVDELSDYINSHKKHSSDW